MPSVANTPNMLSVVILSVVLQSVVRLTVVAPFVKFGRAKKNEKERARQFIRLFVVIQKTTEFPKKTKK
jgi:hypothetical protein